MLDPFARPHRGWAAAGGKACRVDRRLILFRNPRSRLEDAAVACDDQEKALGDLGGSSVQARDDVHPVMILPQPTYLQPAQVVGLAQSVQDLLADGRTLSLTFSIFLIGDLFVLLFRWHRFFRFGFQSGLAAFPANGSKSARVRVDVRDLDANQIHLNFHRLPSPTVVGIDHHGLATHFHDANQAALPLGVQEPYPLADRKVLVFREPGAIPATYQGGIGRPISSFSGHAELGTGPRGQADQRQSQSWQTRMVNANGQFERPTVPGGGHGTIGEALHVMDLDTVTRLSCLHGFSPVNAKEPVAIASEARSGSAIEAEPFPGQTVGTESVKGN
jgi:hypothetical protein